MDIKDFKEKVKKPFHAEYKEKVKSEGYNMALGIGFWENNYSLEVRLQPLENSPDPIPTDLLDRIKNEILPSRYEGAVVNVEYIGVIKT
ncbi:MAG: hypothetical protein KKA62_00425 [Nanoarchaeota archaeon]|nr:hypothetical protein [Nanoarchaeota archaeon]MBU1643903.1 hypothetical protein [Nanoarchaeota archaeon]MBU1976401.1 hypothetical protein [Nanoarchaeota archaeon]